MDILQKRMEELQRQYMKEKENLRVELVSTLLSARKMAQEQETVHSHRDSLEPDLGLNPQLVQLQQQKQLIQQQQEQPPSDEETFIFANLIDYKSFEFLSKLYKISEKLVDHDNDLLIMNMWYKVVENRPHNFEILTKFLIHNLSSFIMKLRATSTKETQ